MLTAVAILVLSKHYDYHQPVLQDEETIEVPALGKRAYFWHLREEADYAFETAEAFRIHHRFQWPFATDVVTDKSDLARMKRHASEVGEKYRKLVSSGRICAPKLGQVFLVEGYTKLNLSDEYGTQVASRNVDTISTTLEASKAWEYFARVKWLGGSKDGRQFFMRLVDLKPVPNVTPRSLGVLSQIVAGSTLKSKYDVGSDLQVSNPNGTLVYASESAFSISNTGESIESPEVRKRKTSKEIAELKPGQRLTYLGTVQAVSLDFEDLPPFKFVGNPIETPPNFVMDTLHKVRLKNGPLKGGTYYVSAEQVDTLEIAPGRHVVVGAPWQKESIPAAFDISDLSYYLKRKDIGDNDAANAMITLKRVFLLKPNRTCYLIEMNDEFIRVQVGSGPHTGKKLYIANRDCVLTYPDPWAK